MPPKTFGRDVIRRWKGNPLLALQDLPFRANDIHNAGVIKTDGEYLLLVTVEGLEGRQRVSLAHSTDGHHFWVDKAPFLKPSKSPEYSFYERHGVRDTRITRMDDRFYIVYVGEGDYGPRVGIAQTTDFKSVTRLGFTSEPDTKNGTLFPQKINGRYALLERPAERSSIWLKYSDDLTYWSGGTCVMTPRAGYWDSSRVGAACPPIEVSPGWLLIYYGVKGTSAGPLFRLGAAILDKEDPSTVIARSNIPILSPRERYERIGDQPNLVFSCGAILQENDEMQIYYGASDSCICLGTAHINDILHVCI